MKFSINANYWKALGVLLAVAFIIESLMYTINEGERGVLLTMGKVSDVVAPGFHFKAPVVQDVVKMSTRTYTERLQKVPMYSYDQQVADLGLSVTWHYTPDNIRAAYAQYGKEGLLKNAVIPKVLEVSKAVFGTYTAARSIQERGKLNAEMFAAIKQVLVSLPFVLESVQIENIDFSDGYEKAVEAAAQAKADVERSKSELLRVEQEAQQKVKNAEAEAEATRMRAEASAYAVKISGDAEASAIKARGEALRNNPDLVKLIQAERWNGALPTTMVPTGTLPVIGVK